MHSPFNAGATTTITTPSPADRRGGNGRAFTSDGPLARRATSGPIASTSPSAYSTPARPAASSGVPVTASKSVRFSPAYSTPTGPYFQQSFTPTSAPPSRLTSSGGPLPSSASNPLLYQSSPSSLSSVPPPRPNSAPSTPNSAQTFPPKSISHATESLPPLGRGAVARRLRINSVLLVFWWLSGRTNVYGFASGHLVQLVPSLDTPLHFLESSVLLLLFYNICESMYKLNELASLPSSATTKFSSSSSPRLPPKRSVSSPFGAPPVYSSPKTRPSPSMSPSPTVSRHQAPGSPSSPFRASARSSPTPPTPQTPSSMPRVSTALRRSTLAPASPSPPPSGAGVKNTLNEGESPLVKAYLARHSPDFKSSLSRSVSSRQEIERLLME